MPARYNFSLKRTLSVWDDDGQSFIGYALYAVSDYLRTREGKDRMAGDAEYFLAHGTHDEVRKGFIRIGRGRELSVEDFGDGKYSIEGLPASYDTGTFENAVQAKLDERFALYRQERDERDKIIQAGKERHRQLITGEEGKGEEKGTAVS